MIKYWYIFLINFYINAGHFDMLPTDIIKEICVPSVKSYALIKQNYPICLTLSRVNKRCHMILSPVCKQLKKMVRKANKPDEHKQLPIMKALQNKDYLKVKFLIEHGAIIIDDIKNCSFSPFYKAIATDDESIISLFMQQSLDVNKVYHASLWTPLFYAIKYNCLVSAKVLLENGANPNTVIPFYLRSPLHLAAQLNNLSAVKLLLLFKADHNLIDYLGSKAYDLTNSSEIKQLLNCK